MMSAQAEEKPLYASILVPMDLEAGAAARARLALGLADKFASWVIGTAAQQLELPLYADGATFLHQDVIADEQSRIAHDLAKAEALFRAAMGNHPHIEWRSGVCPPSEFASLHARAADLIVVPRAAMTGNGAHAMTVDTGTVVMTSGRPILVVPPDVDCLHARHVVVAWKNTREARRTIWDSLPLLKQAQEVCILAIGQDARLEDVRDVCDLLGRHGVVSRPLLRAEPTGTVTREITDVVAHECADLLVCGAYGHSRTREWIFGGVTEDLLRSTPVSCLMSH